MKILTTAFMVVLLAGCGQQFRYPCQDPANWDKAECKPPLCEVNRDCPAHIFEGNERIKSQLPTESKPASAPKSAATTASSSQGECK